jgi:hypothetical protein
VNNIGGEKSVVSYNHNIWWEMKRDGEIEGGECRA